MSGALLRPARWVVVSAICASLFAALTFLVVPMGTAYDAYVALRLDEEFRLVDHLGELRHVVIRAARSRSTAGVRRGESAAREIIAGHAPPPTTWEFYSDALYYAHIVLGRLDLASGDVGSAREELAKAGELATGNQLHLDPDMTLAQELLERGESKAVQDYLTACARYWPDHSSKISSWSEEISSGRHPDFGLFSGLSPSRNAI